MDDEGASLSVGFIIDTGGSFDELAQIQRFMESTEAKVVADAARIEKATSGMVRLGGATAQMSTFGIAATREMAAAERASRQAEKAAEGMIRQLQRQAETFGMTAGQARAFRAEQRAVAAESAGLTEVAGRLRAVSAEMTRLEAASGGVVNRGFGPVGTGGRLAGHHVQNLAFQFQDLSMQMIMAAGSSAPLKMAFMALMQQGMQIQGIMSQAGISFTEALKQLGLMTGVLREVGAAEKAVSGAKQVTATANGTVAASNVAVATTARGAAEAERQLALAFGAAAGGAEASAAANAQLAASNAGAAAGAGRLGVVMAPLGMVALAAGAAFGALAVSVRSLQDAANDGADMEAYAASLGLTAKEIRNLDDVTVTFGDTAKAVFQVAGRAIWAEIGGAVTTVWDAMKGWIGWVGYAVKWAGNYTIGAFVGAYNSVMKTWQAFPAALGDVFFSAVNAAIGAINALIKKAVDGANSYITSANALLNHFGLGLPTLTAPAISEVDNQYRGAAAKVGKTWRDEMGKAMGTDYLGEAGGAVIRQARQNARDRIRAQALEKGYLDPEKGRETKPKVDRHAEQLAREAAATEAQIRNLYALAEAYGVSGAAALIAEARVKAESEAIKKRADVEAAVARQVRLSIAQRVSDAAKSTAVMRDQADAQAHVNAMVVAGLIPAERAADVMKDRIADLPLLAALEAAQKINDLKGIEASTKALAQQRAERARGNMEEARAKLLADTSSGFDQLEKLRLEASLINATNKERAVALAQLEVEQYLRANAGLPPDEVTRYRDIKVGAAALGAELATTRSEAEKLIEALTAVADQTSIIGDIMGSAFGNVGTVFGDIAANLADYRVQQAQLADQVFNKTIDQAAADKQLAVLQMRNTAQAISGVKSLFKEKSTAFKIMSGIEKAYAIWQAADTVASMVRDATKTSSHLANSAVRTTANTAEGGSKIFAELGPWAFPVVAAMVAVLAALGARGGGGGRSGPSIPSAEDMQAGAGTGTVLGDPTGKSESIARSLELVAANTNSDLEYSNAMLKALRSIDSSIAQMAGTVARQIQVSGSMFDTSKLKLGTSGSGGFLGIGASSTTRDLWDLGMKLNSASVADIIASGISGSTYQTVQKVKKKSGFFGIGGGTKTSYKTTTGTIDAEITAAVQDVVRSLRDGLVAGASLVGLQGAQAILDGFQVNLGTMSFKGMTGDQIEDQLNAIFSSVGDQMAGKLLPSLSSMQLVGEGLFETFMRVAKQYEAVDVAMRSIGRTFGMVGVASLAARNDLVQLLGGLDEFVERTNFFRDRFLTEAQQIAPVQAAVLAEIQRLGLSGLTTRNQFRDVVLGLDLTTASGREMYSALMALAPAFDKVLDYQEKMQKQTVDGLEKTFDQFTKFAEGLRKYRETLFATGAAQGNAYATLRAKFIATSDLAAQGNAGALGDLESAGKAFLDTARNNASTREQYLRDVALVARGVDAGIFAAEETADYAKLQLDAMANAVSILGAINANTALTAEALLNAASASQAATAPTAEAAPTNLEVVVDELREEIAQLRSDTNAGNAAIAGNTGRIARKLEDVTSASGGDAFTMVTSK